MWKDFLAGRKGHSFFLDNTVTPSPDMHLYTNASGTIGFGGHLWEMVSGQVASTYAP